MEKLERNFYITTFVMAALSIIFSLIIASKQREFFYFAFYIAALALFFERRKIKFPKFDISYLIIAIGLIKIIWTLVLYRQAADYGFGATQLDSGKKLIVGGILIFYLAQFSHYRTTFNYHRYLLIAFSLAFILATGYGLYQIYNGIDRIAMSTNRATIAAYIYSALSILLIYLLLKTKIAKGHHYITLAMVFIISFLIITMTGTRAAILAHPLLIILMMLFHYRKIHLKSLVMIAVLISLGVTVSYDKYIKPKFEQTSTEILEYQQGNDFSSLGSRFSLWNVGLNIFLQHPFGNTVEARHTQAENIVLQEPKNKTAMVYIDSHLHDELLESASLQGVAGLFSVLALYIAIIALAVKRKNTPLLMIGSCMIVYGLTDVLLISSESLLFFISCIAFFAKETSSEVKI
ncbi:O-antigen ligase family protein [Serratia marcescens]|uniref:O-antigen ligase family protein n=1 Tax=Serratia sp. TSA_105.2 TaxID=3415660 RepID=UPI0018D7CBD1|nr:O-antigen ligase family protein [Serratia marcescens]MBH2808195.1 O-antigen ligase family protein [Serratia marcescens]MBN5236704.1 O-antigen ligase family protein [Serratia marcescens]MBN5369930.1 O-antigen ligase family protein [Serratia marcescens]